jgi:hypothetical protein
MAVGGGGVSVATGLGRGVSIGVLVGRGVSIGVLVGRGVFVALGVGVGVCVGVLVGVCEGRGVGVAAGVGGDVDVGVGLSPITPISPIPLVTATTKSASTTRPPNVQIQPGTRRGKVVAGAAGATRVSPYLRVAGAVSPGGCNEVGLGTGSAAAISVALSQRFERVSSSAFSTTASVF